MTIFVDALFKTSWSRQWPYTEACHMTGDDEAELHAFAQRLGLRRAWFQVKRNWALSHYDLTASKRAQALALGAQETTALAMFERAQAYAQAMKEAKE